VSDIVTVDIILPHRWTDKRGEAGYEWIGRHSKKKRKNSSPKAITLSRGLPLVASMDGQRMGLPK
jgi:hypothetical protein